MWVLIPQDYTDKTTEKRLTIPAGEKPLPMFVGDVPPTQHSPENFIGYLLGGLSDQEHSPAELFPSGLSSGLARDFSIKGSPHYPL